MNKTGDKILKALKSNLFAIIIGALSMLGQSKHTYDAFIATHGNSINGLDIAQGLIIALVIDLAVIYYTVRKKTRIALGAGFCMVLINGAAYWGIHQAWTIQMFFGLAFALMIPASVYFYSETMDEDKKPEPQPEPEKKPRGITLNNSEKKLISSVRKSENPKELLQRVNDMLSPKLPVDSKPGVSAIDQQAKIKIEKS